MLGNEQVERGTWRAQTGGTYNFPSSWYGVPASGAAFPTAGTIPVAQSKAGTMTSNGPKVRGDGTTFLTDIYPGDFIYSQNVLRRVKYVETDTMLTLDQGFPANLNTAPILVCHQKALQSIYIKNVGAGPATVQETPFLANQVMLNAGSPIAYQQGAGILDFTVTN